MKEQHLENFDNLLKACINIGNKLTGVKNPSDTMHFVLAEGLGRKILLHSLSARNLYIGYQLATSEYLYKPTSDFSSIAILTRAAFESYLAFNHIFIASTNDSEMKLRFLGWHLAGFLDRTYYEPKADYQFEILANEKIEIEKVKESIRTNDEFLKLTEKRKKLILNGYWRMDKTWLDLATDANFTRRFFNQQYKFLCGHSHSSRLSIIQIQQSQSFESQKLLAAASIGVLMVVNAKFTFEYFEIIPGLKELVDIDSEEFNLIKVWKEMGENLYSS
jgi:hypothetical protein